MNDRRVVPITLGLIALVFFIRAGWAYWSLDHILPIVSMMQLPSDDPMSADRFEKDLRFSVVLFGVLGIAAIVSGVGALFRKRWARWIWLAACTVMTFSVTANFFFRTEFALRQIDLVAICLLSWYLLRRNGLSRASVP